jgi:hypothetical protein
MIPLYTCLYETTQKCNKTVLIKCYIGELYETLSDLFHFHLDQTIFKIVLHEDISASACF